MLFGLCQLHLARAEYETALEIGQQLLGIAEEEQDTGLLVEAHAVMGVTVFHQGEIQTVLTHLKRSTDLYDREQHRSHAAVYGQDPWVASRSYSGLALWLLGYPQQAVQRTSEALRYAQEIEHPFSHAFALHDLTLIYQFQRNLSAVQQHAEALLALASEQKFPTWEIAARTLHAWVLVEQGQSEAGAAILRWGIDARLAIGMTLRMPYQQARLAEACGKNKQPEEGLVLMERALATVARTGERWWEAELYRLKGELTLQSKASLGQVTGKSKTSLKPVKTSQNKSVGTAPRPLTPDPQGEAEACFLKALEVSRHQQAKSLELRAAMSLARLWESQGKHREAHTMLSDIYNWFTEGFDTKDLQEAKALLEGLGETGKRETGKRGNG
jgi:predicted ATPase